MEITCDIAMDLVELYTCGAASEDSCEAVKNHLKTCKECRSFYEGYKKSIKEEEKHPKSYVRIETEPETTDELLTESVRKLSKRLRKRKIVSRVSNIIFLIICAAVVITGIFSLFDDKEKK